MSPALKLTFFVFALATMASLAAASVMMAEQRTLASIILFALAVCLMGAGFALRRWLRK